MKFSLAILAIAAPQVAVAFAPSTFSKSPRTFVSQRSVVPDASILADAHQHIDSISSFFSSITISDISDAVAETATATAAAVTPEPVVVDAVATSVSTAAPAAADAAAAATDASTGGGPFGFLQGPIEFFLGLIHTGLVSVGMDADAWGVTIISMVVIIKLATYPLTQFQTESLMKTQAVKPKIDEVQKKYASNPEVMNQKIAEIYSENGVNPLAGCLPAFLQIPIFIGLYRAVLALAKEDKLNEPFLFLPNLEGPVYGADPTHGLDWLLQGWSNGAPALGWEDTLAFLTIPVILVITQLLSLNLTAPKDQEQPAFTKFIPLLIGWFSLSVPAALGIYWVANNIVTTALTLQIRSSMSEFEPVTPGVAGGAGATVVDVPATTFTPAPMREKPAGFGASELEVVDGMTPITPMDATIVEEATVVEQSSEPTKKPSKKRGKKKKKRKN